MLGNRTTDACSVYSACDVHHYYLTFSEKVREGSYLPPRGLDDGATCLQRGHDASLGDGDALLLHGLVDAGPVLIVHLGVCTN